MQIFALVSLLISACFLNAGVSNAQNGACDICIRACNANPTGVDPRCITACNENLDCTAPVPSGTPAANNSTITPRPATNSTSSTNGTVVTTSTANTTVPVTTASPATTMVITRTSSPTAAPTVMQQPPASGAGSVQAVPVAIGMVALIMSFAF